MCAKLKFVLTVALIFLCYYAQSQSVAELWNRARQLKDNAEYQAAIEMFKKVKTMDSSYAEDCEIQIRRIHEILKSAHGLKSSFMISRDEVHFSCAGGEDSVLFSSDRAVTIIEDAEWLDVVSDSGTIRLFCMSSNETIQARTTMITVRCGDEEKYIKVVQKESPEYLTSSADALGFSNKGGEHTVLIESNADWQIVSSPMWCTVRMEGEAITVFVEPNPDLVQRNGDVIIASYSREIRIRISQETADEFIQLSSATMSFPAEGNTQYVHIQTNAKTWSVGDFPRWLNVERVGEDSLKIVCVKNVPNGEPRTEMVQIKTSIQAKGIMVVQEPRFPSKVLFPESKIVSGRNISLGVSANVRVPSVVTSSGGDFVGSVVDYSLADKSETASYQDAFGYGAGIYADIRLYGNLFTTIGCDAFFLNYRNHFEGETVLYRPHNQSTYMRADSMNDYDERYEHFMLEFPIMFSWRFRTGDVSNLGISFGPVINYGLKSKLHLSGTTGAGKISICDNKTHVVVSTDQSGYYTMINDSFDLYSSEVIWDEVYTESALDTEVTCIQKFASSPLKRLNASLRLGLAYEIAGFSAGLSYTAMITNMANNGYWDSPRWNILCEAPVPMSGYKQYINYLEFKLAYTFRY